MPELPEVEGYRKYIAATALDQPIAAVQLLREKVLKAELKTFSSLLKGNHFVQTDRVGKYLFLQLKSGEWIMMHFGLTGKPIYYSHEELQPKYSRLIITFTNGFHLAYTSLRMFGRIELTPSVETYRMENKIGKDATLITEEAFVKTLAGRKAPLKSLLLQQQHFAGVGNWIADEILYRAKIHPKAKAIDLSEKGLSKVYEAMQYILKIAIREEANYQHFPDDFMVKERWGEGNCPSCSEELQYLKLGGRGTYYCESCQSASQ